MRLDVLWITHHVWAHLIMTLVGMDNRLAKVRKEQIGGHKLHDKTKEVLSKTWLSTRAFSLLVTMT
jgi:hypothetical protein